MYQKPTKVVEDAGGVERRSRINNKKPTKVVEDAGGVEEVVKTLNIRKQRKNRIVNSVEEKVEYVRPNRRRLIGGVINIHSNERLLIKFQKGREVVLYI